MSSGRDAILSNHDAASGGNFRGHLGARQYTAMAGFCSLGKFYFNHFYLWCTSLLCEAPGVEASVCISTTEVTRAQFPDEISAIFSMVRRNRSLSRVMGKTSQLRTTIE